jgi:hypothetical protein
MNENLTDSQNLGFGRELWDNYFFSLLAAKASEAEDVHLWE